MGNSPRVKEAIKQAVEELRQLSKEEFLAELEKHKDGPFAKIMEQREEQEEV
jgi:hypothetical protein